MPTSDEIFDQCWRFVRGDMAVSEFENWVYETSELQLSFSVDCYMNLISTDYSLKEPVYLLKKLLQKELGELAIRECECHTLPNLADVGMGHHDKIFRSLNERAKYGESRWWLWLAQCSVCEQFWMIGSEERINDVFIMKRLSIPTSLRIMHNGRWPDDLKEYGTLLKIGRERGHSVRFFDPVSPALVQTAIDLAETSPGIKLQEISDLLQVSAEQAEAIVDLATKKAGVSIIR